MSSEVQRSPIQRISVAPTPLHHDSPISRKLDGRTSPRPIHPRHIKRRLDPLHLSFLVILSRAGEGSLVHGRDADRTGIVSPEDECVFERCREELRRRGKYEKRKK